MSDPLRVDEGRTVIKDESSMETPEKVVKRLNDKNYLFVPRTILKEADKIDLKESEPETEIDSNEEIGSGFQLNRKAIVRGGLQPAPSPVTFLTDSTTQGITEEITDPQKLLEITEEINKNIPETTPPPGDDVTEVVTASLSWGASTTETDIQDIENSDSPTTLELVSKFGTTDNVIGITTEQDTETTEQDSERTEEDTKTTEEVTEMPVEENEKTEEVTETTEENTETTGRENEISTKSSGELTKPLEEYTTAETLAKESTEFMTESQTELSIQSQDNSESGKTQNKSRVVKRVRRKHKTVVKTTRVKTKRESSSDEETKREDASSIHDDSNEHETTSSTNIDNDSNENNIKAEGSSDEFGDDFKEDEYKFASDGYDYNEGK